MRKKIMLFLGVMLMLALCTACEKTSEEARAVSDAIEKIGTVTLDKESAIKDIGKMYEALTDEDKAAVKNHDDLEAANEALSQLKCKDLDDRIHDTLANADNDHKDAYIKEMQGLVDEYDALDDADKGLIMNIDSLQETLARYEAYVVKEAYNTIKNADGSNLEEAKTLFESAKDQLDDEQIVDCLENLARWGCVSECESLLSEYLKSPGSYKRYGYDVSYPDLQFNGSYKVKVELDYSAANSYNAEIRDHCEFYASYYIDEVEKSYHYSDVSFTDLYAYEMISGH